MTEPDNVFYNALGDWSGGFLFGMLIGFGVSAIIVYSRSS